MLRAAFVGALSSSFAERVREHLTVPCDFIHTDEKNAVDVLSEVDVLMTPHLSGWTDGTLQTRAKVIAENIGRIARGEVPVNLVQGRYA